MFNLTEKVVEIWLAEYGKMKKTQMVIKAGRKVVVTDDKEALKETFEIMDKAGIGTGVGAAVRKMWMNEGIKRC